ncbi:MAG: tetratricopeptide repeat protein [Hyphomicrobiaceae bacterium]
MKRAKAWVIEEEPWAGINDYGKVIELDPNHIDAYSERAKLYAKLEEHSLTKKDLSAIVKIIADDPTMYCRRGLANLNLRDFNSAIEDYNKALELDPSRIDCVVGRGDVFAEMGEYKKAFQDYNAAIAVDVNYRHAYMRRGRLYKEQGEKQLAIADYTKVIEFGDFDLKAMRELQSLGKYTPWHQSRN